jgi:hypothetical protein
MIRIMQSEKGFRKIDDAKNDEMEEEEILRRSEYFVYYFQNNQSKTI